MHEDVAEQRMAPPRHRTPASTKGWQTGIASCQSRVERAPRHAGGVGTRQSQHTLVPMLPSARSIGKCAHW